MGVVEKKFEEEEVQNMVTWTLEQWTHFRAFWCGFHN
jgi:hypothetical protein